MNKLKEVLILSIDFDVWHPGVFYKDDLQGRDLSRDTNFRDSPLPHCGFCRGLRGKKFKAARRFVQPTDAPPMDVSRLGCRVEVPSKETVMALIPPRTEVYVAECHAEIVNLVKTLGRIQPIIVDLDHHIDDVRDGCRLNCSNWINKVPATYKRLVTFPLPRTPDITFLCKSTPYTPKEADRYWDDFLKLLEERGATLKFFGWGGDDLQRRRTHESRL